MRILIVGAGIAGLTLAALLHQRGTVPDLVERASSFGQAGYMLGLYPLGSRVLHGLGLFPRFVQASQPMTTYDVCNGRGDLVHTYEMTELMSRFGHIGHLERRELLDLLRSAAPDVPLRMGVALRDLQEGPDGVRVHLSDGTTAVYDLVIGADGLHSRVRDLAFGPVPTYDTGWSCWVWWAKDLPVPHEVVTEYWGAGRFVGVYPTRGTVGIIAAGPTEALSAEALGQHGGLREAFSHMGERPRALVTTAPAEVASMYFWKLSDLRCPDWHKGRVVLMGDSACAFLPTAGVGASMAMESAAVLADELGRTDQRTLPFALDLYEKRRKKRAEAVQDDSRHLARMMMVDLEPLAWGRDQLMKLYSLEMLAANLRKSLEEPI